jgi:hypothetical protein
MDFGSTISKTREGLDFTVYLATVLNRRDPSNDKAEAYMDESLL